MTWLRRHFFLAWHWYLSRSKSPSSALNIESRSRQVVAETVMAEQGIRVKATGFGRVDFDVASALNELYRANPDALMFGTDLPSTRAPRPYEDEDLLLVVEALGETGARKVLYENALDFYRPGEVL